MMLDAVDFHVVEPGHRAIHARLENWAQWANGRPGSPPQPMFRLYRPDAFDRELSGIAVDSLDATKVQKAIVTLPRRYRLAIQWCYLSAHNPKGAARLIGESLAGLFMTIRTARQMLVAQRV